MKQENYRDYIDAGLLGGKKRFSINDILGWKDSYKANPGSGGAGAGQFVFALYTGGSTINMGQCTIGSNLIPWGVRCVSAVGGSSACSASNCTTAGFTLGTETYVALGSVGDCGATLWRRI
jgi:hypothetical protein